MLVLEVQLSSAQFALLLRLPTVLLTMNYTFVIHVIHVGKQHLQEACNVVMQTMFERSAVCMEGPSQT